MEEVPSYEIILWMVNIIINEFSADEPPKGIVLSIMMHWSGFKQLKK